MNYHESKTETKIRFGSIYIPVMNRYNHYSKNYDVIYNLEICTYFLKIFF